MQVKTIKGATPLPRSEGRNKPGTDIHPLQRAMNRSDKSTQLRARQNILDAHAERATHGAAIQRAVIQREGEESRGSQAITYGMLGATIGARAGIYGAAIGGALGTAYGYATGYSTYSNHQQANYQSELNTYQQWLAHRPLGASAYNSGQIFTYHSGNEDIIHSMLCEGKVMYTYDIGNQLRVSGNHGAIKHAIVAGNKDVYAAGTVDLNDPVKNNLGEAISQANTRDENLRNVDEVRDQNQKETFGRYAQEAEQALLQLGFERDVLVSELVNRYENTEVLKTNAQLDVTEDSGHYSPSYDSGHKALEAWRNAGYKKINWTPRWTRRKFMQSTVENVDE